MTQIDTLRALGLFDARVPRYTSYPTAAAFSPHAGAACQDRALRELDPADPVSVYIHIPFCERLCWFCACHTQGTRTLTPVESYVETLEAELAILRNTLPSGIRMGRLHWGGGTPTILPPELIHRLAKAVEDVFPRADEFEFSVEIDPTLVDQAKIRALAENGMTRASIGIQDFDAEVQTAIGRAQPYDVTRRCVDQLRGAGITSLNTDLVYGLPYQSKARLNDTIDKVLTFAPERVALFGYAHVPWVAKRQKLIKDESLPDNLARFELVTMAAERLTGAGLSSIGIDHFARPGDELETAMRSGRLRRNFQGYTADTCQTLIGVGASSISRLPDSYVQNTVATGAYQKQIAAGHLAGARGYHLTGEDHLRASAIEHLMCDFSLDLQTLAAQFGAVAYDLHATLTNMAERFAPYAELTGTRFQITPEGRPLTRIIASALDLHVPEGARYSQAS